MFTIQCTTTAVICVCMIGCGSATLLAQTQSETGAVPSASGTDPTVTSFKQIADRLIVIRSREFFVNTSGRQLINRRLRVSDIDYDVSKRNSMPRVATVTYSAVEEHATSNEASGPKKDTFKTQAAAKRAAKWIESESFKERFRCTYKNGKWLVTKFETQHENQNWKDSASQSDLDMLQRMVDK